MSLDATATNSESKPPVQPTFWGPGQQVAALVVLHLGLTCPAAYLSLRFEYLYLRDNVPSSIARFLVAALYGFQISQILLLVSWGAFAGQSWLLRLPRFLTLFVWTLLLSSLGESFILGGFPMPIVEEQSAFTLFLMLAPVVALFSYGICLRRRFVFCNSVPGERPWQFSTRSLMLITAELALLLALEKVVLNNRFRIAEFWSALHVYSYLIQELIPALVSVTILPVVFLGLAKRRPWHRYAALAVYLLLCSLLLAWVQLSYLSNSYYSLSSSPPWWPEFGRMFGEYLLTHLAAAATILFTFYLLRRIGYDFRRRDELPLKGGRNSSNARNSAASASA